MNNSHFVPPRQVGLRMKWKPWRKSHSERNQGILSFQATWTHWVLALTPECTRGASATRSRWPGTLLLAMWASKPPLLLQLVRSICSAAFDWKHPSLYMTSVSSHPAKQNSLFPAYFMTFSVSFVHILPSIWNVLLFLLKVTYLNNGRCRIWMMVF